MNNNTLISPISPEIFDEVLAIVKPIHSEMCQTDNEFGNEITPEQLAFEIIAELGIDKSSQGLTIEVNEVYDAPVSIPIQTEETIA